MFFVVGAIRFFLKNLKLFYSIKIKNEAIAISGGWRSIHLYLSQ